MWLCLFLSGFTVLAFSRSLGPEDYQLLEEPTGSEMSADQKPSVGMRIAQMPSIGALPPSMQQHLPYCDEIEVQDKADYYQMLIWAVLGITLLAIGIAALMFFQSLPGPKKNY